MQAFFSILMLVLFFSGLALWLLEFYKRHLAPAAPERDPLQLCVVGGVRCRFIRFIEDDKVYFRIDGNYIIRETEADRLYERFKSTGIVPPGCSLEKSRKTWALVETPEGAVVKLEPDLVKFLRPEGAAPDVD